MSASRVVRLVVGLVLIAVGAMLVHHFLHLGALEPDTGSRRDNRITADLLLEWRRAEVLVDTSSIEFGTVASQAHYHEPDPRRHRDASGILSRDFKNGTTVGFACGDSVTVEFVRRARGPVRVELTAVGIPPDEAAGTPGQEQTITVRIRGEAAVLAELNLPGDATPRTLGFDIPAAKLARGENVLEFAFARTVERTFEGHPSTLRYGATFVRLDFRTMDGTTPSATDSRLGIEEFAAAGSGPAKSGLVFMEGTRVVLPVRFGTGRPRFVASIQVHPDDVADRDIELFARYRTTGDAMASLGKETLDARTPNPRDRASMAIDVDLSTYAGTSGVIELETDSPPPGAKPLRLVLVAPVVRGGDLATKERTAEKELAGLRNAIKRSNVVVILLDAAGAKHFSAYGAPVEATPNLAALARDGVVFENTTSPASYTLPSVGSLFTGMYPSTHGVVDYGSETERRKLADSTPTLAQRLKTAGYTTHAFISNPNAGPEPGYDRGFDVYERLYADPELWNEGVTPEAMNSAIERRLAAGELKEPFFLYAHYFPPHAPYRAPAKYHADLVDAGYAGGADGSRASIEAYRHRGEHYTPRDLKHLEQLYLANLRYVDDQVMRLLHALNDRGLAERTLFVVVGDHGEAFGEHSNLEHGDTTFAEEIEVPWFMRFPAAVPFPPTRVPGPCSLVDVAPTLLSLLGIDTQTDPADGLDLSNRLFVRTVEIDPPERAIVSRSAGFEPRYVIRMDGFSYHEDLWTRERWLFDLVTDPSETKPNPLERNAVAKHLRAELCRVLCNESHAGEVFTMSEEELELAAQAGYLQRFSGVATHSKGCPLLHR